MPTPTEPVEVYVEETPNPHARKFLCSTTLLERGSLVFNTSEEAAAHPVAEALFAIDGVRTVFITKDFVTVTCTPEASWRNLQPAVWATLVGVLSP